MSDEDRIKIRVSEDGLEAWATLDEGEPLDRPDFDRTLAAFEISEGLEENAVREFVASLRSQSARPREVCLARGQSATKAIPPNLVFEKPEDLAAGTLREDGSLDFRSRFLIHPIETGDVIGRVQPTVPGKPGWTVQGESIEPEPCDELDVQLGDGVALDADGVIVATRPGARFIGADGSVDVVELYVHAAPVDLASGHLETRGSLEVARDVTIGMKVSAGHDLKINGTVDGGFAEAGGSIQIGGGVIGRDCGYVRAGNNIDVRHALGARLFAGGRIRVARSISASKLHAHEVDIQGTALGDSVEAETLISVKDVGSAAGGPCVLRVGIPLDPKDFDPRLRAARVAGPVPARKQGKRQGKRPTQTQPQVSAASPSRKGGRKTQQVRSDPQINLDLRLDWRRRQSNLLPSARIEVKGTAHAGCRLEFGTTSLTLDAAARNQTYRLDRESGKIVVVELKNES